MKSGLEGRNNTIGSDSLNTYKAVSMKSGLEGRNNSIEIRFRNGTKGLNEVRPRRPEQMDHQSSARDWAYVSMKSGLEGRNKPRLSENTLPFHASQ